MTGHELASLRIAPHIAPIRRYNKFCVPYLQALLVQARKQTMVPTGDREIVHRPGNSMLRYVGGTDQPIDTNAAIASAPEGFMPIVGVLEPLVLAYPGRVDRGAILECTGTIKSIV